MAEGNYKIEWYPLLYLHYDLKLDRKAFGGLSTGVFCRHSRRFRL